MEPGANISTLARTLDITPLQLIGGGAPPCQ